MHYRIIYALLAATSFVAPSLAVAQIGWTPAQMEANYGKPTLWIAGSVENSVEARYKPDSKHNNLMASLGVTNLNVDFRNGTVYSMALNNEKDLTPQMVALGTAIVDEHPEVSKAFGSQTFSKGVICKFYYKDCSVTAMTTGGFIVERSQLAVNAAKMGLPMQNPQVSASTQQEADSLAKALRKK